MRTEGFPGKGRNGEGISLRKGLWTRGCRFESPDEPRRCVKKGAGRWDHSGRQRQGLDWLWAPACGIRSRSRPLSQPPLHLQAPAALIQEKMSSTGVCPGKLAAHPVSPRTRHPCPSCWGPDPATGQHMPVLPKLRSASRREQIPMLRFHPELLTVLRDNRSFKSFPGVSTIWPSLGTQLLQVFP